MSTSDERGERQLGEAAARPRGTILHGYVANLRVGGKEFLYLAWERVQEPTGTTNTDFEFNQSTTVSGNGVTPVRTAGDVLIKYDLSQGGVNPVLGYHRWITTGNAAQLCEANNTVPCWDKVHSLSGNFDGSINTASVSDPIAPNAPRTLSPRTFGEAAINLTDSGITVPANWSLTSATCGGNPYAGESVSFVNTPLTDFTVSVNSQVDGGTASTIQCTVVSGSTGPNGDGSVTAANLPPGTYTCEIVIDP